MKTLFDEQIQAKIQNHEKKERRKLGLKIWKSDDPSIDEFGIELYDEKKLDFLYKKIYSRAEYEKIRTEQGLGGFDELDSLIIDFIKNMEHCDNDWLQITENTDATCNFDLMSRKRKGYRTGSQLQLILSKVVGEDLVRHIVSKAESLQEKFEEGQERINLLSDELKEKDKVIKQQAVENSTLNENVTTLNEEITTLNKKVAELDNNLEAERDANQQLADELGDNIHIIEELKSENADYRQTIAELRQENLTLDEEVEINIKYKEEAEAETDEMEEKLEILKKEYRKSQNKLRKLYEVAKRREEDVVRLNGEMFDETSKVKNLVALCDQLKNDNIKYENLVRKLEANISQLDARMKIEELKKR